jgi:HK97 family phage prohead protease
MNYKTFQVLREEDKSTIASLWDQYVKAASSDEAPDTGWFKVLATTDDVDRDGEVIAVDGWEFDNYDKNPVVLWAHDFSLMPIAKVTKRTKTDNGYLMEGPFAPSERGQEARRNYDAGFLNTVSVGFIPKQRQGNVITKSELLELSFVPVPANANAVAQRAIEEMTVKMLKKDGEPAPEPVDDEPVEDPADADVPPDDIAEKGIVADVAAAPCDEQTWQMKYGNISGVSTILGALYEVYMRPEVGVDDFDGLLKECVDLLNGLLGARTSSDGKVAKAMASIDGKSLTRSIEDNFAAKAGRVLSAVSRKKVSDAMEAMMGAHGAMKDLLDSSEPDDGKASKSDPTADEGDATAKGHDPDERELVAAVLRGIDKAVGKELRNLKRG